MAGKKFFREEGGEDDLSVSKKVNSPPSSNSASWEQISPSGSKEGYIFFLRSLSQDLLLSPFFFPARPPCSVKRGSGSPLGDSSSAADTRSLHPQSIQLFLKECGKSIPVRFSFSEHVPYYHYHLPCHSHYSHITPLFSQQSLIESP